LSTRHLLDPELAPILEFPTLELTLEGIPGLRETLGQADLLADPDEYEVSREEITFTSADGSPISGLLYQPREHSGNLPGYLHLHGGGYLFGSPKGSDGLNLQIASQLGVVVLSVDYRLAPEYPIPLPLDDSYAGLAWLHSQASNLKIDPSRIAVGGESAGGGLAATLAIRARDAGEYSVCHQHLTYPMLDNLTGTPEQPGDPLVGEFVWTRESNELGWTSYLGDAPAVAPQVPARVVDCAGLPPAWIFTAGLDLFRDENIAYAQRLLAAGVAAELLLYPSACHAFQMLPDSSLGVRFTKDHLAALGRGLSTG